MIRKYDTYKKNKSKARLGFSRGPFPRQLLDRTLDCCRVIPASELSSPVCGPVWSCRDVEFGFPNEMTGVL